MTLDFFQTDLFFLCTKTLIILFFTILFIFLTRRTLSKLSHSLSGPEWLKAFLASLYGPSAWLIGGLGTFLILEQVASRQTYFSEDFFFNSRAIYAILLATWTFQASKWRYENILKKRVAHKISRKQDETLILALSRLLSIFVFTIVGLIILDILGIQLTALLAFGGIGGIAIGWAGKDIVANFFAGFMIQINRHFSVGDWIISPNKGFEGTVEHIGWYMTQIRTFSRRPTYIPNSIINDAIIENPGRMYNRRIKEIIGIRYQDGHKVNDIVNAIEKMLRQDPEIDQTQILLVHFVNFGPYSLNIEVYCFTKTTDWKKWREIQQGIFLKIIQIISSYEAEIALPTQSLQVSQELNAAL